MKLYYVFFMIIMFLNCKSNYTASELVSNQIRIAEEAIDSNEKSIDNFLESLSGIHCENKNSIGHQSFCNPTKNIVNKWKKWYIKNKYNFYFNTEDKCVNLLYIEEDRKRVVFLRVNDSNEIRSSLSKQQINTCSILKNNISSKGN